MDEPTDTATPPGLTAAEVAERVARGQVNGHPPSSSRSLATMIRANVFTRFNAIIGAMFVAIVAVGEWKDALFIWVVILNSTVGIVQELRARATLDALTVLGASAVAVRRDDADAEVDPADVVVDDVIVLHRGDQVPVDAIVLDTDGAELDESLLTGEADTIVKAIGDELLSGSVVMAGRVTARATRVGADAYARKLTDQARSFALARSELREGTNQILRLVTFVAVPIIALLLWSQFRATDTTSAAVTASVAGAVAMVPEGLVLLTSIALTAGVVRLGKLRVLTRELAAIEGLARVDVLCVDKTGTLTQPGMRLVSVSPVGALAGPQIASVLAALGSLDADPNPSLAAIAAANPQPPGWAVRSVVPFSSARKWSAASFSDEGNWMLGAPEILLADGSAPQVLNTATAGAAQGQRMLLLARSGTEPTESMGLSGLEPVALVELAEVVKNDVAPTLAFFAEQGVTVKVISGDNPITVAAVAQRAGLADAANAIDARTLPTDDEPLSDAVESASVFGRVTPEQKRSMVHALQRRGHTVAMTGDGVNDLLALKDADVGVAMGQGSGASRSVAQFVLLDGGFAALPAVVAEGRRVIANIERLATLFLTKTTYALLLALASGISQVPFPFLPRQLSVVGSLTIGIPAFFIALGPNTTRARAGFVDRVLRFAIPAGTIAGVATFAAYLVARHNDIGLNGERSVAVVTLFCVATWVLTIPIRPLRPNHIVLLAATVVSFIALTTVGFAQRYLEFESPPRTTWAEMATIIAGSIVSLEVWNRLRP